MVARYVVGFVFTLLLPSNSLLTPSGKYFTLCMFDCNLIRKLDYILPSNHFNCLIFWMLSHWDEKCLHNFRPTKRTFDLSSEARLATFNSTPWYHNGMKIILELYSYFFYYILPRNVKTSKKISPHCNHYITWQQH